MFGIDWKTASWQRPGAENFCNVVIAGDWAPIRRFGNVMLENPAGIYDDTLDVLRAADCRIVNLECAMDDGNPIAKSGPNLKGGPEHMACFDVPKFDAATLANNHVMDFGAEAFEKTLALLDEHKVKHVGAGRDAAEATNPLILDVKGLKVGIVNFGEAQDAIGATEHSPGIFGWELNLVEKRIAELKKVCDTVLVIVHAGLEFIPYPPDYVREGCRRVAAAGADAVIAHHPHVPQGLEFFSGVPIFYSLGNYVFYQAVDYYYRKLGYLVGLDLDARGKLAGFTLHPYRIDDRGVHLLTGERFAEFTALMEEISAPLAEHGNEAWNAVMKELWSRGHLRSVVAGVNKMFDEEPVHGAARMFNHFVVPCNYEYFKAVLRRFIDGTIDDAPEAYFAWAKAYNDRKITEEGKK